MKASYTKSREGALAYLEYITHRPGRTGGKTTRELFGLDGLMESRQAYRMINEAKNRMVFYRIMISPDAKLEDKRKDLYLRELTINTMIQLEERLQKEVNFVATEHNDQTDNRHVHILALIDAKLNVSDLNAIRDIATEQALFQRRERDLAAEQQVRGLLAPHGSYEPVSSAPSYLSPAREKRPKRAARVPSYKAQGTGGRLRIGKPAKTAQTCPRCGKQQGWYRGLCGSCGMKLTRARGKGVAWER